jgi:hypothetical protein
MTNPVKKHYTMTIKDFYKEYSSLNKSKDRDVIPYKKYKKLIEAFFLSVSRRMIVENFNFMMPYSLGSIYVNAFKPRFEDRMVDWNTSKKVGKIVKHLNTHTFGYCFKIRWDKTYVRFTNRNYYVYKPPSSIKATKLGIGRVGLNRHIMQLSKDPTKKSFTRI